MFQFIKNNYHDPQLTRQNLMIHMQDSHHKHCTTSTVMGFSLCGLLVLNLDLDLDLKVDSFLQDQRNFK